MELVKAIRSHTRPHLHRLPKPHVDGDHEGLAWPAILQGLLLWLLHKLVEASFDLFR